MHIDPQIYETSMELKYLLDETDVVQYGDQV